MRKRKNWEDRIDDERDEEVDAESEIESFKELERVGSRLRCVAHDDEEDHFENS